MTGTLPLTGRPALVRGARMRWDATRERHVLLGPETVVVLNPTGADILGLCDGERSVADITGELAHRWDRVVDEEVAAFLEKLVARRWLVITDD